MIKNVFFNHDAADTCNMKWKCMCVSWIDFLSATAGENIWSGHHWKGGNGRLGWSHEHDLFYSKCSIFPALHKRKLNWISAVLMEFTCLFQFTLWSGIYYLVTEKIKCQTCCLMIYLFVVYSQVLIYYFYIVFKKVIKQDFLWKVVL